MYCAFCGSQNPDDATYCAMCARPLNGTEANSQATASQPTQATETDTTQSAPSTPSYLQPPAQPGPTLGASTTCAVCGFVLAPFDTVCQRCKTPRGMSVDPNAEIPGGYKRQAGYGPTPYDTDPVDKTGWSPINAIAVITRPVDFFTRQRGQKTYGQAVAYGYIMTTIYYIISALVKPAGNAAFGGLGGGEFGTGIVAALIAPILAAFVILLQFVGAAIMHLFCMIFGVRGGMVGTYRVMVYANSPATLLGIFATFFALFGTVGAIIALIAMLIGVIWTMVLEVIGLREVHMISTGAAIGAVLLPMVICMALVAIPLFFIGMAASRGGL